MDEKPRESSNPFILIFGILVAGFGLVAVILKGLPFILSFVTKKVFVWIAIFLKGFLSFKIRSARNKYVEEYLSGRKLKLLKKRRAFFFEGPFKIESIGHVVYKIKVENEESKTLEGYLATGNSLGLNTDEGESLGS